MRINCKHRLVRMAAILALVVMLSISVSAATPNEGYCYNRFDQAVPAPAGYVSDKVYYATQHDSSLAMADDLYAYGEELYVLKKDTGEISVFDADLVWKRDIRFSLNGEEFSVVGAQGMCINDGQDGPCIYLADTANHRVLRTNMQGEVLQLYEKPTNALYPQEVGFNPVKVLIGADGIVYVISQGLYKGAATFSQDGEFLGFFGSNAVEVTAAVLLDYFWKSLMNEEQLGRTQNSTPIEYTNFTVDKEGFIYTCTRATDTSTAELKRLNAKGDNVFPKKNYGDLQEAWLKTTHLDTAFVDIVLLNDTVVAALDNQRGRVFLYTNDGDMLLVFGDSGLFKGGFKSPTAIETLGNYVYVMDPYKNCITRFSPTEYGETLLTAARLFQEGEHTASREYWEKVLQYNANCESAYAGIGKALMANGEFREAMAYFQLGGEREFYSQAYNELRKSAASVLVVPILIGSVVLLIFGALWRYFFKGPKVERNAASEGLFYQYRYTMAHPIKGFEVLLKQRTGVLACVITGSLGAMLFAVILFCQNTAFIFNPFQTEKLNVGLIFALIVGLYAAFVIVNRLICTIFDGNGTVLEIAVVAACSLIPTVIALTAYTGISYFFISSEQIILDMVLTVGIVWSLVILLSGLSLIQEYNFKQTLFSFVATLIGIVLALFVLLLVWTLCKHIGSFIESIITEITLMQL